MKPPTTPPSRSDRRERLERQLLQQVGKAIGEWKLIEPNDRIMVGLSGGKDSYTLMHLLGALQKKAPIRFEIIGVNLDQGDAGFEGWKIENWLKDNGFQYRMLREDTRSIVKAKIPEGQTYCSLCSRLRRGILYDAAVEMGCTKIALGHHRDDVIGTLMLNLFFAGQLKAMPARLHSDDGRNVVIRPLVYCAEEDIAEFAEIMAFPILPCDLCGSQEQLQRKQVKRLLAELEKEHPHIKSSILNAVRNVRPTHLLDPQLGKDAPRSEGGTAPFESGVAPADLAPRFHPPGKLPIVS